MLIKLLLISTLQYDTTPNFQTQIIMADSRTGQKSSVLLYLVCSSFCNGLLMARIQVCREIEKLLISLSRGLKLLQVTNGIEEDVFDKLV